MCFKISSLLFCIFEMLEKRINDARTRIAGQRSWVKGQKGHSETVQSQNASKLSKCRTKMTLKHAPQQSSPAPHAPPKARFVGTRRGPANPLIYRAIGEGG